VALSVVAFGLNVPPTPPSDHDPVVAEPPTDPPKAAEVPPLQIALKAAPALAVGADGVREPVEDGLLDAPQLLTEETETVPTPEPIVIVTLVVP